MQNRFYDIVLFLCLFLSAMWLCLPAAGADGGSESLEGCPVDAVVVDLPAGLHDRSYWESTARSLILMVPGTPYRLTDMHLSIQSLSDSGLFRDIHVPDPHPSGRGVRVAFRLVPFDRIKKITIDGAFPISRREILTMMTCHVGGVLLPSTAEDQAQRIESFLKKEGYINPRVDIRSAKDPLDGFYELSVNIEKGPFLRVASAEIKGNRNISAIRFTLKTGTWKIGRFFNQSRRFEKKSLDDDMKAIIRVYRKNGFADVSVTADTLPADHTDEIRVVFNVTEGPRYAVEFEGNSGMSDRALNKEITLYGQGNRQGAGIRKSLQNIRQAYLARGFQDVRLSHELIDSQTEDGPVRRFIVRIEEGPQYVVSTVDITGNSCLTDDEIRTQILSGSSLLLGDAAFDKQKLEEDLDAVRTLYLNHGFTQTAVTHRIRMPERSTGQEIRLGLEIMIDEGPRTVVGGVDFSGLAGITREQAAALISLTPGSPFQRYMIESDENRLKTAVSENGYPHVAVNTVVKTTPDAARADLTFRCDPGPLVRMGKVIYAGNFRTRTSVLDRAARVEPSEPLSLERLFETRQRIMDIEALDRVRFRTPGLGNRSPTVNLIAEVQEKRPYFVELEAGYDTRRKFYTQTSAGDQNFMGRNLTLKAGLEASQIGYDADLRLTDPSFMGSGISSSTRLFAEESEEMNKDYGIRIKGISQEFDQKFFDDTLTVTLGTGFRSSTQYETGFGFQGEDSADTGDSRGIVTVSPSLEYRTTDSHVKPTRGLLVSGHADLSKGVGSSGDDFVKYQADARYYYSPMDRFTLAFRGKFGLIHPYGGSTGDRVPEDQLFFLGGTSSVRGFEENMLRFDADGRASGGREMLLGSIEARIDLKWNLELALFLDTGRLSRAPSAAGPDRFRSSAGAGIRYMTPIGPLSILYGQKLDPQPEEDGGCFHFSLGYTF